MPIISAEYVPTSLLTMYMCVIAMIILLFFADLKAFERRIVEYVSSLGPQANRWRGMLVPLFGVHLKVYKVVIYVLCNIKHFNPVVKAGAVPAITDWKDFGCYDQKLLCNSAAAISKSC